MLFKRKMVDLVICGLFGFILGCGCIPEKQDPPQMATEGLPLRSAPNANLVTYLDVAPSVVHIGVTENVNIWVQTDGTVTSAEVEHFNGSFYPLTDYGGGLFGVTLSHAQVLYNYTNGDYHNVNRFGYLNLYQGSTQALHGWLSVGVYDGQIPTVSITNPAVDMKVTPHLVNIQWSFTDPSGIDQREVAKRFYQVYGDDYDFLNIISSPSYFGNRYHYQVKNAVTGIGLTAFDDTALFGSSGRLLGITRFPIPILYFDGADRNMPHETGHQWINFLSNVTELQGVTPHWPISELARSTMGFSTPGGQGLAFNYDLIPQGDGSYLLQENELADETFNAMDMYLMGLAGADEVGSYQVFTDQNQDLSSGVLYGPTVTVDVNDVIAAYGTRTPAYPNAQTHFRMANIIVSPNLLSSRELTFLDYFARRGEATISIGATPWAVSTWGRSTISMGLGNDCDASKETDLWFFSHRTSPDQPLAGQDFSIIASAVNSSSYNAYNVTFFDYLPDGLEFVSAKVGGGSCYGDKLIVCTRDIFYAGESVTMEITVRAANAGAVDHTVGISSCSYDEYPSNNASTLPVTVDTDKSSSLTEKVFLPLLIR